MSIRLSSLRQLFSIDFLFVSWRRHCGQRRDGWPQLSIFNIYVDIQITLYISIILYSSSLTDEQRTMSPKKILIILSDANSLTYTKTHGKQSGQEAQKPTGYFLMEVAKPLKAVLDAGYEVTFASPRGKTPHPDPMSESLLAFAGDFYERRVEKELIERMRRDKGFDHPRTFKSINNAELDTFAGVFIPGGHSPLVDLGDDPELGRILRHFHSKSKPTAALCHGPYAFLSTKLTGDKEFAYKGYRITSWSDVEENLVEKLVAGDIKKTEASLRDEGAVMVEGSREKVGCITVDKELVSGGNPVAAATLGNQFVKMLTGRA